MDNRELQQAEAAEAVLARLSEWPVQLVRSALVLGRGLWQEGAALAVVVRRGGGHRSKPLRARDPVSPVEQCAAVQAHPAVSERQQRHTALRLPRCRRLGHAPARLVTAGTLHADGAQPERSVPKRDQRRARRMPPPVPTAAAAVLASPPFTPMFGLTPPRLAQMRTTTSPSVPVTGASGSLCRSVSFGTLAADSAWMRR